MKKLMLCLSCLFSSPLLADVNPNPGQYVNVECVSVRNLGGGYANQFQCFSKNNELVTVTVMKGYDYTGTYAVGFEAQTRASLDDLGRAQGVITLAAQFIAIKLANPSSPAILKIRVTKTKIPNANNLVVDMATLVN